MDNDIVVYIVLLYSDAKRVAHVENVLIPQLHAQGYVDIVVCVAVDGKSNAVELYLQQNNIAVDNAYLKRAKRGQLACSLSHLSVWKRSLAENTKKWTLVIEDDAVLDSKYNYLGHRVGHSLHMKRVLNELSTVETEYVPLFTHKHQQVDDPPHELYMKDMGFINVGTEQWGTVAYLATKSGLTKMVENFRTIRRNTDEMISDMIVSGTLSSHVARHCTFSTVGQLEHNYNDEEMMSNVRNTADCSSLISTITTTKVAPVPKSVAIVVITCNKYRSRASVIDQAWANKARSLGYDVMFVIGDHLLTAPIRHADNMLIVPCKDNYESLPVKVHMALRYLADCGTYTHLIKTDDDMFLNMSLIDEITFDEKDFYMGNIIAGNNKNTKWHFGKCEDATLNTQAYTGDLSGKWASGGCYILSCDLAKQVGQRAVSPTEMYEDRMVGTIVVRELGKTLQTRKNWLLLLERGKEQQLAMLTPQYYSVHLDNQFGETSVRANFFVCAVACGDPASKDQSHVNARSPAKALSPVVDTPSPVDITSPVEHALKCVTYINLDAREDRRTSFISQMARYSSSLQVVRFPAIKHDKGYVGCTLSHYTVLRDARKQKECSNADFIAVFEDDFEWKQDPASFDGLLARFFDAQLPWDVLLLGASPVRIKTSPTSIDGIRQCHAAHSATAYLVKRKYIHVLMESYSQSYVKLKTGASYEMYALDQHWKLLQAKHNWYICVPAYGKQMDGYSDIEGQHVSYPSI